MLGQHRALAGAAVHDRRANDRPVEARSGEQSHVAFSILNEWFHVSDQRRAPRGEPRMLTPDLCIQARRRSRRGDDTGNTVFVHEGHKVRNGGRTNIRDRRPLVAAHWAYSVQRSPSANTALILT